MRSAFRSVCGGKALAMYSRVTLATDAAFVKAYGAGALIAMAAETMIPEAFHNGPRYRRSRRCGLRSSHPSRRYSSGEDLGFAPRQIRHPKEKPLLTSLESELMINDGTSDAVRTAEKSPFHASCFVAMLVLSSKWYRDSVARRRTVIRLSATPWPVRGASSPGG